MRAAFCEYNTFLGIRQALLCAFACSQDIFYSLNQEKHALSLASHGGLLVDISHMQHTEQTPPSSSPSQAGRTTLTQYSADEVIANFQALYDSYNFSADVEELHFSLFQFKKRNMALQELRVVSIALWFIALKRSFPDKAEEFFAAYRAKAPFLCQPEKKSAQRQARLNTYLDLLRSKAETDFSPVAAYLADIFASKHQEGAKIQLKLSLVLRQMYNLIFERLV